MIIVKMNSSTVECSIAASELREIGLTPESLINGEQRSVSFMAQLNKEVGEQLGYNPEQEVLLMSKNMMSDGSVRIFAVKMSNEDIQRTAERIREAAQGMMALTEQTKIDTIKSQNGAEKAESLGSLFVGITDLVNHIYMSEDTGDDVTPSATLKNLSESERYLVELESLDEAIRFSAIAQDFPVLASSLYKQEGTFYLLLTLANGNDNVVYEFRKACVEYGDNMLVNSPLEPHILEMGDCLIEKDAILHLKDMK